MLSALRPDIVVTVTENIRTIRQRLDKDSLWSRHRPSLEQLLYWREIERITAQQTASLLGKPYFLVPAATSPISISRLFQNPTGTTKIYFTYPARQLGRAKKYVTHLKQLLEQDSILFDAASVGDWQLLSEAREALTRGIRPFKRAKDRLREYDPENIFEHEEQITTDIIGQSHTLLEQSDALVAILPRKHSAGVAAEIAWSNEMGKRTYIVTQEPSVSPFLRAASTTVVSSPELLLRAMSRG